jgi:flagellar hook-length control protein FliK
VTVGNVTPAPASTAGVTPSTQPADVTDVSSAAFSTILVTALAGTQAVSSAQTMTPAQSPQPSTIDSGTTSVEAAEEELSIEIEQLLPGDIAALLGAAPPVAPSPPSPPAPDEIDMTFSAEEIGAADLDITSEKPAAGRLSLSQTIDAAAMAEPMIEFSAPSTPESPQTLTHVQQTATTAVDAAAQPEAAPPRELRAPVGTPAWADEMGGELTLMTQQGRESASLKVTPEHLGPIEIRITLNDKDASVWFGAAHSDTRAALEQALPRLRELFESQGLALTDAGVFRDPPKPQSQPASLSASERQASDNDDSGSVTAVSGKPVGLLDTYV